jgi:hypothetical protein
MNPLSLYESYVAVYDEELLYVSENYAAIDEFSDEELIAIVEQVISEEGFDIDESLEFLDEAKVTYGHDTEDPDAQKKAERVDRIKSAVSKAGSMAKDVAKKVYKTAKEKGPGLLDRAKKAVKGALKTGRSLLAKGLRKGAEFASKAASKVEPKESPKSEPKTEPKADSPKGGGPKYRNVGVGRKERVGGKVESEPKSVSEPNKERIEKAREKLRKAAKGSSSRGVRFATPGGKVAPTVMRSGRDSPSERTKAASRFAKKAGISDSFEYLLGVIFDDMINEGYVSDYETASYVLESLAEDDFDYVFETYSVLLNEATAMAKRGLDEPAIRQQIAKTTGGGQAADRATALADRQTYGQRGVDPKARQDLARKQRGDFRNTTSSNPGLHGYANKVTTAADKAKQAARGLQRGVLTPVERQKLNMGDDTFDTYDLILEFLYVEGYAETIEEAEQMMVNLTQEQIDEIIANN